MKFVKKRKKSPSRSWPDFTTFSKTVIFDNFRAKIPVFDKFCICFELFHVGAAVPYIWIVPFKVYEFADPSGYFLAGMYGIFLIVTLLDIYRLISKSRRDGFSKTFKKFWNMLTLLSIIMSVVTTVIYAMKFVGSSKAVENIQNDPHHYDFINLRYFGQLHIWFVECLGVVTFFAIIRYMKILNFNVRMKTFSSTLETCLSSMIGLTGLIMIYLMAFAWLGRLIFGSTMKNFHTLNYAVVHMLEVFIGKFAFGGQDETNRDQNRIKLELYYVTYTLVALFFLLNMFIAVLDAAIGSVKKKFITEENELEILDFVQRGFNDALPKLGVNKEAMSGIKDAGKYIESSVDVFEKRLDTLLGIIDEMNRDVYEAEISREMKEMRFDDFEESESGDEEVEDWDSDVENDGIEYINQETTDYVEI